jgi:hypothetical protein
VLNWIDDEAILERFAAALRAAAARAGSSFDRPEPAYFVVRSSQNRVVIVRDRGSIGPRPPGLIATSEDGKLLAEYDLVETGWTASRGNHATPLSDEEVVEQILALAGINA